jgi:hypothetical protein
VSSSRPLGGGWLVTSFAFDHAAVAHAPSSTAVAASLAAATATSVVRSRQKTGVDGHAVCTASQTKANKPTVTRRSDAEIAVVALVTVAAWGIAAAQTSRSR